MACRNRIRNSDRSQEEGLNGPPKRKRKNFVFLELQVLCFPGFRSIGSSVVAPNLFRFRNFFGWLDTGRTIFFYETKSNLGHFYCRCLHSSVLPYIPIHTLYIFYMACFRVGSDNIGSEIIRDLLLHTTFYMYRLEMIVLVLGFILTGCILYYRVPNHQYCGSVTFWYRSGSAGSVPLTNGSDKKSHKEVTKLY
jgi:hypothetical protein